MYYSLKRKVFNLLETLLTVYVFLHYEGYKAAF